MSFHADHVFPLYLTAGDVVDKFRASANTAPFMRDAGIRTVYSPPILSGPHGLDESFRRVRWIEVRRVELGEMQNTETRMTARCRLPRFAPMPDFCIKARRTFSRPARAQRSKRSFDCLRVFFGKLHLLPPFASFERVRNH